MGLDFTKLTAITLTTAQGDFSEPLKNEINSAQQQSPSAGLTANNNGVQRLQREADNRKAEADKTAEIYKTYQNNIMTSNQLQTEIIKGVKQGESVYTLFLKAAKAISLMTSNSFFYSQIEADIRAIYGAGLLEISPLELELDAVKERLQRLREAQTREGEPEDSRQRIANAVKAHESRAEHIKGLLEKS